MCLGRGGNAATIDTYTNIWPIISFNSHMILEGAMMDDDPKKKYVYY